MYHNPIAPPGDERRQRRFTRLVALFERDEIEAAVDALIAYLDARDGDPDLEDDDPAGGAADDVGEFTSIESGDRAQGYGFADGTDDDEPSDDRTLAHHVRRLHRTRCEPVYSASGRFLMGHRLTERALA